MHQNILLDNLPENHLIYPALTHYFAKHVSDDYSIAKLLIYFASHESNKNYLALVHYLHSVLTYFEKEDTGIFRSTVEDINATHPLYGGNALLRTLFERGSLLAIYLCIKHLPIILTYQDNEGNTILHQLSNSCKNIFNYLYDNAIDDEIDDDSFPSYQIEYAREILNYLKQDKKIIDFLTKQETSIFNKKNESALSIFLNGYNNSFYVDCVDELDIPFLNDLLIAYPKKIIMGVYQDLCQDAHNLSDQFLRNILKDALLDLDIITKRFRFHHDNFAEHIFEEDLNFYEKIPLYPNKVKLILSHFSMIQIQREGYTDMNHNNLANNENHDRQRAHSWAEGLPSLGCSPQANGVPNQNALLSDFIKKPALKNFTQ